MVMSLQAREAPMRDKMLAVGFSWMILAGFQLPPDKSRLRNKTGSLFILISDRYIHYMTSIGWKTLAARYDSGFYPIMTDHEYYLAVVVFSECSTTNG
jgi:hypothetical protein